jgi:signal transduction histidine kinase/ligand-binding sensor domain-containing protein/DNA-binding NarL/FixJ family response regulator
MERKVRLFIIISFVAWAQGIFAKVPDCTFSHYSTHDGLSHSGVMCIHQDRDGFMWFGTWDGLNKFDGYQFTNYKSKPGDTSSLSHNRIDFIMEDQHGFLWVKTYDEKAHRFDKKTESYTSFPGESFNKGVIDYDITEIHSAPNGDVWLNTRSNGCFRIITDTMGMSSTVRHYSTISDETIRLPSNEVYFILQDKAGQIWISTGKGIKIFEPQNDDFSENIPQDQIFTAHYEGEKIWLGTKNGRLWAIGPDSSETFSIALKGQPHISLIKAYNPKTLLIGTRKNGLYVYHTGSGALEHYDKTSHKNLVDNNIVSVYTDKYGLVWIETEAAGVVKFDMASKEFKYFQHKIEKVSPYVYHGDNFSIFEDVNNMLWINKKKGGFCFYDREKDDISYFYNEPGASNRKFSNLVTSVASDRSGNLWMSTHSSGIEKISFIEEKFNHYYPVSNPDALSSNNVRSIFEDNQGHLWVGTKEGKLFCYKNNTLLRTYSNQTRGPGQLYINGMVYCIAQSSDGALWFGTKGDGIVRAEYNGNPKNLNFTTQHFRHTEGTINSLNHNWVYSIFEDRKGNVWVGTYGGGVNIFQPTDQGYVIFNHQNSDITFPFSKCNQVRFICDDANGNIWVGTTNGLVVLEIEKDHVLPSSYTLIQKEPGNGHGLANNDVHYILRDHQNNMWVSTFGGGLGKAAPKDLNNNDFRFEYYTTKHGLPIDIVLAMVEDEKGNLWLSTENGISRFNPKSATFLNFSELDGLKSMIFSEATCCKGPDGKLYFGSLQGFYSFYPDAIEANTEEHPINLVNLQLFNQDVEINDPHKILEKPIIYTQAIQLNHKQSVFSIEYAGLYFKNPEKLEYAFMLEGFEEDWNYVRGQRKATYTNLPAGTYNFKVQCSLSGKFDGTNVRELKVEVLPPPWKTKWALIIYFVVLALLIWFTRTIMIQIVSLKHKVLLEQQLTDLKLKFFTNISHELRTPLSLIIGPIEELLKTDGTREKTREYLSVIDKNARRMLNHVNNLLDFRKIQTGKMRLALSQIEMVSFLKDIYEGFTNLAEIRKVEFTFQSNVDTFMAWIDPEKMDTVVFNLLSNAFKFTKDNKKIHIHFKKTEGHDKFQILISDEGYGIPEEYIPYIFERFKVLRNNDERVSKGTGIGLSLVKEIVELHKGEVNVESEMGKGSLFIVEMYAGADHYNKGEVDFGHVQQNQYIHSNLDEIDILSADAEMLNCTNNPDAPTILIVEDNAELRDYLQKILSAHYNIVCANNGRVGLEKALESLPDLIISDIMMPGMNGIELLDKLRNEIKTSHIPIILLTAKNSLESEIEGLKYGADAYITKPFKMDFLKARVQNLLEQRKRIMEKAGMDGLRIMDLSPDQIVVTARDEEFIKNVIGTIEENMQNTGFNIESIASAVGMGRTTFFKKLKSLTGMAPIEFLRDMKLKRGYQLIETGEFTISEIAFKLGFSDAGYFTKCFKEKYNTTPTAIMKKVKGNK